MQKYNIHPDFIPLAGKRPPLGPVALLLGHGWARLQLALTQTPPTLTETRLRIPGYGGELISTQMIEPKTKQANLPALVYFHGGAFAFQAAPFQKRVAYAYAAQTPCKVFFVDYRLLPRHPFPVGVEDCSAALHWIGEHCAELNIDPSRIAVGGDSAGGDLAAAVCLMARDRGLQMPCFQMLIYPVTDRRQSTPSIEAFPDTPMWDSVSNQKMWRLYLKNGLGEFPEYASPAEAASLVGMPPAYVEVAEVDCLRDEGAAYARALEKSGVPVRLEEIAKAVHAFEAAEQSPITKECIARRVRVLKEVFCM